ncbi:hypothetical protein SD37_39740 [Amycolatopsis orientalis]|uniref:Uncharacterized protein n=1 Tax=Amycolatopsis orientalis TaxID=31958 RepID=A0A193C9X2_AMYOR|nr:hypothetical protein [Amycolatopsis orientalis]ANN21120.1 hypothetical protein SD37_39740 [Amycolatopsis orientalis]
MPPNTGPTDPTAATKAAEPRSAAEHCAAAEALFARARAIYPTLSSRAVDQDEYRRCLDWARMHLRIAEAITSGAGLVFAQHHLLANPNARPPYTHAGAETQLWNEHFESQHDPTGRPA